MKKTLIALVALAATSAMATCGRGKDTLNFMCNDGIGDRHRGDIKISNDGMMALGGGAASGIGNDPAGAVKKDGDESFGDVTAKNLQQFGLGARHHGGGSGGNTERASLVIDDGFSTSGVGAWPARRGDGMMAAPTDGFGA